MDEEAPFLRALSLGTGTDRLVEGFLYEHSEETQRRATAAAGARAPQLLSRAIGRTDQHHPIEHQPLGAWQNPTPPCLQGRTLSCIRCTGRSIVRSRRGGRGRGSDNPSYYLECSTPAQPLFHRP